MLTTELSAAPRPPALAVATRTAREVPLAPVAVLFAAARAAINRPAALAALTVVLVCAPVSSRDVSASIHVTPADLGSVALAASVVVRLLAGGRLPRARIWVPVAAAGLGFGIATLGSQDPSTSASGFVRYLQLFVIVPVAVVFALRERRDLWLVCAALLAAAVVEGTIGTWQYLTGTGASFAGQNVRAVGTFGALDVMGMSTVVGYGLVVALGLAVVLRGRARLGLLAIAALLVVPLLLSFSRGAVVATLGATAVMLVLTIPRLTLRIALFGAAAAVVLSAAPGTGSSAIGVRLATIGSSLSSPDRSVSDRYELWQTAVAIWRDHPVTGVGLKEFPAYRDSYAPLHLSSGSDVEDTSLGFQREPLLSPHNMYLLVLSEQGLVGALGFGGLLLSLAIVVFRRGRRVAIATGPPGDRGPDGRLISAAAVGIVAWTLLNFLFSDVGGQSTVLMSVLIGVALWGAVQPRPTLVRRPVKTARRPVTTTARYSPVAETTSGAIVRATVLASVLTVAGSLLGLIRDLLVARFFGATGQTDAFLVAWTVPETASPLLIEGAMTFLMVPIFVRALAQHGGLTATVRATLPRIAGLLTLAAGAVAIAAPVVVHLLAPGLAEPAIAVRCTRITALAVLTFGLAGYLGAALRSKHIFGWPASIYIAYNIGILGSMALLHKPLGVTSAAIGVAVGSVLMVAVQAPAFLRRLEPAAPRVRRPHVALIAFVPIAVFTVTRHAQVFIERILGSELSAGTISHLNYAQKVAQVPMVLSIMVATVTFPMLARSIATGDEAGSRDRAERDLRLVSAVVLVASAYIVAFAAPIIRLLFEHGAFTAQDTAATAAIMRVYAFGLLGQAAVGVLTRSYFSQRESTWYPAVVMAVGLAATALISIVLLPLWHGMAIAAGNAAGITLTAGLMLRGLRSGTSRISASAVGGTVARLTVLTGVSGVVGWMVARATTGLPTLVTLIVGGFTVGAVFLLLGAVTGAPETGVLTAPIRKLRARGGPAAPFVLMYHSVGGGEDPYRISVSRERFAEQMQWLRRHGLRGTSMRELLDAVDQGRAAGLVGLTFDDGYADFVSEVLPVLDRYGFTATVFVVAGKLGGHNDWDEQGPDRPLMTTDQVREVARMGIEVGSHGFGHRALSSPDTYVLRAEIEGSRVVLEALLGVPVRGFCYPYGHLSDSAMTAVQEAGYDYAVATRQSARRHRHALPRTYAGERDNGARLRAKWIRHRLVWGAGA